MLKWIGRILFGLAALLALAAVWLYQPDVSRDEMEARYGGPDSRFVTLMSGAQAHYRDRGPADAPVLLLLHGSNASLHTWEPWVAILKDQFRVITVDLPGHGLTGTVPGDDYSQKSMAGFVLEFVAALRLDHIALGGNSMGGGVAARFAIDNPRLVSRLILVDAAGLAANAPPDAGSSGSGPSAAPVRRDPGLGFRLVRMPIVRDLVPYIGPRYIFQASLETAIVDDQIVTPDMVDRYWLLNRMEGTRRATMARFGSGPDETVRQRAAEITVPTLILWGDQDSVIPVAAATRWKETVKGSELIVYPGIGHIPMEEIAEKSADDVRRFLLAGT